MRIRHVLGALGLAAALALAAPGAFAQGTLTPDQQKQVEDIVRRIIKEQPRLILDALQDLRRQEEAEAQTKALKAVKEKRDEIVKDPTAPVAGNPDGDVAVVEFFDYRCPYCKSVAERVIQTAKKDGKVKVVFKELPILGPESVFASRAALAAQRQGKYLEFHIALMNVKERLTDAVTMRIAAGVGLDVEKLKKDMASPEISRILEKNTDLAEELNIRGTPAFIIGDQLVPGAIDTDNLEKLIAQARKK
ncbi:MAG: DsbA family protein [Alphaproteobacteria bacterium]|nr:DsbA family protein [Alphaproteobacteria bacterium]